MMDNYYEILYSNKLDNLKEIGRFLDTCSTKTEPTRSKKSEQSNKTMKQKYEWNNPSKKSLGTNSGDNTVKICVLPKLICICNTVSIKISTTFFTELVKKIPKIHTEPEKTWNSKNNPRQQEQSTRHHNQQSTRHHNRGFQVMLHN